MVSPSIATDPTSPSMNRSLPTAADAPATAARQVSRWLFACALFVASMVALGGYTRLSHAGLSITEWKPVTGTLPPLTAQDWAGEYAKYRASPEFQLVHHWMSLEDFKGIFWIEWAHRLLGRVTGLAVLLPLLWFVRRGALRGARLAAVLGVFALGGLQGFLGWYMVASGLVRDPNVSHFRLTIHLLMALVIFVSLVSLGLRVGDASAVSARPAVPTVRLAARVSLASAFVTVAWGGLVAGLKAGLVCNTFPMMHGRWIPEGLFTLQPAARNFVSNALAVQFVHRSLAYTTAVIAVLTVVHTVRVKEGSPALRRAAWTLLAAVGLQITLGALTVLTRVPVHAALAHQCNALFVLASALVLSHRASARPMTTSA
jgi:cytochrome c oxidase assembly protein subunit 15